MVVEDQLDKMDIAQLAHLHTECLPESTFSLLGLATVKSYYLMIERSSSDWLFVFRVEGKLSAACVLSDCPDTVMRRFLMFRPFYLMFSMMKALLSSARVRKKFIKLVFYKNKAPSAVSELPEVVQIFTDAKLRGNSIGTNLLEQVEKFLAGKSYFLKTDDDISNRAHKFYERNGFQVIGSAVSLGKKYRYYRKLC